MKSSLLLLFLFVCLKGSLPASTGSMKKFNRLIPELYLNDISLINGGSIWESHLFLFSFIVFLYQWLVHQICSPESEEILWVTSLFSLKVQLWGVEFNILSLFWTLTSFTENICCQEERLEKFNQNMIPCLPSWAVRWYIFSLILHYELQVAIWDVF